ncbi:MAG: hypothetical protein GY822_27180 [Deltaproteobacteria bacterium]|nr:hypothetical protein [Deltaproteobacteria bacterium]
MGEEATLADGAKLNVALPTVMDLPHDVEKPEITLRLFRATDEGWGEVASSIDAPLGTTSPKPVPIALKSVFCLTTCATSLVTT